MTDEEPEVHGVIRRRLLVNAVVDPDEAAARLPRGLRPHITALGTVIGCCLLEIDHLRPARLPAVMGTRLRAAAHRISAEWEDERGHTVVGVFVPERRTDSRLAIALGGRWFPGVHHNANVYLRTTLERILWRVEGGEFDIAVRVAMLSNGPAPALPSDSIGSTCLAATIGLSPSRTGTLEGALMEPEQRDARIVSVELLDSRFIAGFHTAKPAPAYLMENTAVTWTPAAAPVVLNLRRSASF